MMIDHLLAYIVPATGVSGEVGVSPFTRKALKVLDGLYAGGTADMRARQFPVIVSSLSLLLQRSGEWPLSAEGGGV